MFLIIIFGLYACYIRTKSPVSFYLSLLVIASSASDLLLNGYSGLDDIQSLFNLNFVAINLLIMIHAFKSYNISHIEEPLSTFKIRNVLFLLSVILSIVLVGNILIVYKSFHYVFNNSISIGQYKNEGEAAILIRQWFPPLIVTFVNLFSSLGYLALSFHFYFLLKIKIKKSMFFLLLALNVPLNGLHGLSRSATTIFILIYIFSFIYVYRKLDHRIKNIYKLSSFFVVSLILTAFYFITDARFSSHYTIRGDSIIQNTTILSLLDYFSQWIPRGIESMNQFSLEDIWYGKSSMSLFDYVARTLGFDPVSYVGLRHETLDHNATSFIGLIATLTYDFSHVFVVLFSLVFFLVVRSCGPRNGVITLSNFILFDILIILPVTFFTNNMLSSTMVSLGIVYSFLCYFILRVRILT